MSMQKLQEIRESIRTLEVALQTSRHMRYQLHNDLAIFLARFYGQTPTDLEWTVICNRAAEFKRLVNLQLKEEVNGQSR